MNQEQPYEYHYEYTNQPAQAPDETPNQTAHTAPDALDQENEKKANLLCFISIGCEILPTLIFAIMSYVTDEQTSAGLNIATNAISIFSILLAIAGFVLMICVRVKYPHSVFGKVLMWLFILVFIGLALLFIFYMAFILITCVSCLACITELP